MRRSGLVILLLAAAAVAQDTKLYTRKNDVVYGRKHGTALTMDVFAPRGERNGSAVIYVASGGWFSAKAIIRPGHFEGLLRRGHTVFAVLHGSQPKYNIPEIIPDIHRAVRYVRYRHRDFGIDPRRVGILGGSAGGHLSLMLGTAGDDGRPQAHDPVEREPSRVQAVAALFPPTDFLNWGKLDFSVAQAPAIDGLRAPFEFRELDPKTRTYVRVTDPDAIHTQLAAISPITHVTKDDAPTLLLHGTRDPLVPLQQSEVMFAKLEKAGVDAELIVREGKGHRWQDFDLTLVADWLTRKLVAR